jgi:hypothetical protein
MWRCFCPFPSSTSLDAYLWHPRPITGASLLCCFRQAVLVWDLHCHLVTSEVVGLLAGTWNAEAGDVCIRAAYPCHTRTDATEGHSCSGLDLGSAAVDEVSVGL